MILMRFWKPPTGIDRGHWEQFLWRTFGWRMYWAKPRKWLRLAGKAAGETYRNAPALCWCRRLVSAVQHELRYTHEYRMGPDAWEQNGNNHRDRKRFRVWIAAG